MSQTLRFTILAGTFALFVLPLLTPVQAQTQASCQFTTFSRIFTIPGGTRFLVPRGVNDYSTVVVDAQDTTDFSVRGFTRSSGGGIMYYMHSSNGTAGNTTFTDRTNGGVNIGVADSSTYTYLASASGTPFTLQGSTFTRLVLKLPADSFYKIRDPQNFKTAIRADVELLHSNRAYLSLTTIIMCCIDALAAGTEKATRGKFEVYIGQNFAELCRELELACANRNGAGILYDNFRNGFAQLRGPKAE